MKLDTLSVSNISARGSVEEIVTPAKLAETRDKTPSSVTNDSVSYTKPMGWRLEIFYGGEFLITQSSGLDDINEAKSVLEDELNLALDEFEYHRVTISGELGIDNSSKRPETIADSLEQHGGVDSIQYGEDNRFGGDVYFKLDSNTVRLFLNQDKPMYSISGIPVTSKSQLSEDTQEQKDLLEQVLGSF